jgi:PPOX class probable F420-dependent enzyme
MANQRAQIKMTDDEVQRFLSSSRTMTMATMSPSGHPHLVAMWFAYLDGTVWFETKTKSQKVQNLRRDPRISCMVEAGDTYDQLRGVLLQGTAEISEDWDDLRRVGIDVFERYTGPFTDDLEPMLETMLKSRVAVKVNVESVASWDHRKLGMAPMQPGGTTWP